MIKPKIQFNITFKCGHTVKGYRADSETTEEEVTEFILHKFKGLCGECYIKYCKEKGLKPWWEK
jgi:hypothetical protein